MTSFQVPYGTTQLTFDIPISEQADWIEPSFTPPSPNQLDEVKMALDNPLGKQIPKKKTGAKVAIAVNDKTRPVPNHLLVPPLLEKLESLGYLMSDICFFFATGTHIPLTWDEIGHLLPEELARNCSCESHDCDDQTNLVNLGVSSRNTPIYINKKYYESDIKIVVGNIEPHHFAGFSGGYKTSVIGLGGRTTINRNHAFLMDPLSTIGEFKKNPLRNDIDEIGEKFGTQYALNVVMNTKREIVKAFFGNPLKVMKAGIVDSANICMTSVKQKYPIVIASVGGHPKDINLYQSQKALTHASLICQDQGVVILVARCPEGSGSKGFEDFMISMDTPEKALEQFRLREFVVGPHKAFQFARELSRIKVILVSSLDSELVKKLMLIPAANLQDAITKARNLVPPNPAFAILSHATNTIPQLS
jgi:nickel-dependent lactate racemase